MEGEAALVHLLREAGLSHLQAKRLELVAHALLYVEGGSDRLADGLLRWRDQAVRQALAEQSVPTAPVSGSLEGLAPHWYKDE